jgi:hypothetical protein
MTRQTRMLGVVVASALLAAACDAPEPAGVDLAPPFASKTPAVSGTCQPAGATGLTALFVNQSVIGATIDFADHGCDMAIYFDADAPRNAVVRRTTVIQETGAGGVIMGLWNNGGAVTVTASTSSARAPA